MLIMLDELIQLWSQDAEINKIDADNDLLKIPNLHAKYASQFIRHTSTARKLRIQYNEMLRIKTHYYSGNLNNKQDLAKHNWEPFQYIPKGKNDIESYLNADPDLNKIKLEIGNSDDCVSFTESVLKEINSRSYEIRAYLEWQKYKLGH